MSAIPHPAPAGEPALLSSSWTVFWGGKLRHRTGKCTGLDLSLLHHPPRSLPWSPPLLDALCRGAPTGEGCRHPKPLPVSAVCGDTPAPPQQLDEVEGGGAAPRARPATHTLPTLLRAAHGHKAPEAAKYEPGQAPRRDLGGRGGARAPAAEHTTLSRLPASSRLEPRASNCLPAPEATGPGHRPPPLSRSHSWYRGPQGRRLLGRQHPPGLGLLHGAGFPGVKAEGWVALRLPPSLRKEQERQKSLPLGGL